jgi:adenylate kinase
VNILLLGPQGSGKGTQAKRVAGEYGLVHIATGDILRAEMAAGTELGLRVKPIYDAGRLVSDELVIEVLRDRIMRPDASAGFVLDGFPRTMPQAEALDRMLQEVERELDVVFELQVSDEECLARLTRRAEEEQRTDDTPEVIARRLALYHEQTEPLVEHYRSSGKVVGIHAERSIDAVFAEIQETLEQVAARA